MTSTLTSSNIDELFDEPFFSGQPSLPSSDVPGYKQVAIGGHGYVIEPSKYSRVTVPLRRESTDESVEPGEQTLNTGGAWRRSQDNWFLGAGQEFLDNRFAFVSVYTHSGEDPSVRTRFWRSKGVNPWVYGKLSLQPEYSQGGVATTGTPLMVSCGSTYYVTSVVSGNQRLSSVTGGVATAINFGNPGVLNWPTITSMTTDGNTVYLAVASGNGIWTTVVGTTTSQVLRAVEPGATVTQGGTPGTTTYTYNVYPVDANGYKLIGSNGNTTTGAATLTGTNFNLLVWPTMAGAASYDVVRTATTGAMPLGFLFNTTGTTFTDDGTKTPTAYTAPTTTTQNFQADYVQYANGYLLGGVGPQLCSVAANGITTLVKTHYNPAWKWNAGCGSPMAIYIAGNCGGTSEIYGVQISTTNFALGGPYIAGQVTAGEQVNAMTYYEGLVVLATSLGIRAAQDTNQNGHLDTGPVITDLGPATCLAVYGAYVWFGVTNYNDADGVWSGTAVTSGLARLNLSQFSTTLLPAYATDVMSTTTGTVSGVVIINGVPYFGIVASGVWTPTGNLVPLGYVEPGWVRYGTVENKILVSVQMDHDPLNGTVQMEIVPFGGASFLTAASTVQGTTTPPYYVSADNAVGQAFMPIPILTRSVADPTKGPVLRRWTVRAIIVAARQDQIVCPIIWRNEVDNPAGDGTVIPYDLDAEWAFLKGLEASGSTFNYQEGDKTYTCFVDQIEMQAEKWEDDKSNLMGILSVKMLTVA